MERADWLASVDVEALLRYASSFVPPAEFRRLAVEYCRRLPSSFATPMFLDLLNAASKLAEGLLSKDQLERLRTEAVPHYGEVYPGHGAPSAKALALCAVGEAVFTAEALAAAVNAAEFAARTLAAQAAFASSDAEYDAVHDAAYQVERHAQANLLRQRFTPFVPG